MYHWVQLCSTYCMHHAAESDSPVCITPQSQENKITKTNSVVCIPLRCADSVVWIPSAWSLDSSSVLFTMESNCTPEYKNLKFCWSLAAFKGINRRNPFGVNTAIMKEDIWSTKSGLTKPKILTLRWHVLYMYSGRRKYIPFFRKI